MEFEEILDKAVELLGRRKRVTYRMLKRQLGIDDELLEDIKLEIITGMQLGVDENDQVLVWAGDGDAPSAPDASPAPPAPPAPDVTKADPAPDELRADSPASIMTRSRIAKASTMALSSSTVGERRQLTVMFADLVGSTKLSQEIDPEDLQTVIAGYHEAATGAIERYDGNIAQYLGDGLLVYFGFPRAHEDDAERAVRAGLDLLDAMHALNRKLERDLGITLQVRIGIHTGLVVVGSMGDKQERLALGETPNIAARIQGEAQPDMVLISESTHRLVHDAFEFKLEGVRDVKGIPTALRLYKVQSLKEEATGPGVDMPLVGRESEVELLLQRWDQVRESRGQVVLITGEAGIGKSRLIDAIRDRVLHDGADLITFRCSPYYTNTAYFAIVERLQEELVFERDESDASKLSKIDAFATRARLRPDEAVPLLASLVSVPLTDPFKPLNLAAAEQKRRTDELLVRWLLHESEDQPLLLLWEDLHWADPSTLDVLSELIDQVPTSPTFALLTFRPEFQSPWPFRSHMAQVILNRFTRTQVAGLVARIAGKDVPREVVEQIIQKTDGVPLFVEEVTKLVLESGILKEGEHAFELTGPLPKVAIPSTLKDSLMARLDRLSTAREVAQVGAAIGREFPYELLYAVSPLEDEPLQEGLQGLVDAELLYAKGKPPEAEYSFKHALIQDLAYSSLLRSTRQQLHDRIVEVLETHFEEIVSNRPELLAHHCTQGKLAARAVPYWLEAGRRALKHSAHQESISHLTQGLETLAETDESPERSELEMELHVALGVPLASTRGYGAPEVGQSYASARRLAQSVGNPERLFAAIYGLFRYHLLKAEYEEALKLGSEMLDLGRHSDDFSIRVAAHRSLGAACFYVGNLTEARAHLEQVISMSPSLEQRALALSYDVVDAWVASRSYLAWTLWLLGLQDQAETQAKQAVIVADELNHPFSQALSLSFASWLHNFQNDVDGVESDAGRALGISQEQGFGFWLGWDHVLLGWARGARGDFGDAVREIDEGLDMWRDKGSLLGSSYFHALAASTQLAAGHYDDGLRALAEGQAFADQRNERFWQAEMHRLKGELVLARDPSASREAEVCFEQAMSEAERQGAKSLGLRAATAMARLLHRTDRTAQAQSLLSDSHGWFNEGLSAPDVEAAAKLLAEMK